MQMGVNDERTGVRRIGDADSPDGARAVQVHIGGKYGMGEVHNARGTV